MTHLRCRSSACYIRMSSCCVISWSGSLWSCKENAYLEIVGAKYRKTCLSCLSSFEHRISPSSSSSVYPISAVESHSCDESSEAALLTVRSFLMSYMGRVTSPLSWSTGSCAPVIVPDCHKCLVARWDLNVSMYSLFVRL